jgi:hypothetical protein
MQEQIAFRPMTNQGQSLDPLPDQFIPFRSETSLIGQPSWVSGQIASPFTRS